jgi:hypothetical protein
MTNHDQRQQGEHQLIQNAKASLDQAVDDLDAITVAKIAARRKAVLDAHLENKVRWRKSAWLLPLSGLGVAAAASLLALALWLGMPSDYDKPQDSEFQDLQMLSSSEDLEFLEELDFYQWLEYEQPVS